MKNDFGFDSAYAGAPASERSSSMPITVLRRPGGSWIPIELTLLRTELRTQVIGNVKHPEYLLIRGHVEKHHTIPHMLREATYTVEKVSGKDDARLPFVPGWV